MYEADGELDRDWIRSLLAAAVDGAVFGAVGREQALAAGRARLARRRRQSAGVALAVAAVVAATGYAISGPGAHGGNGTVTASTAPSVHEKPAIGTASRIGPSPTPSAS